MSFALFSFSSIELQLIFSSFILEAVYHSLITSDPTNTTPEKIDLEKYPARLAITLELCAGIVDKSKTLREIAQEEVIEECGYNVPLERIEEVMTYR